MDKIINGSIINSKSTNNYALYYLDTECSGLDSRIHDVIELTIIREKDNQAKTWFIKPLNPTKIQVEALRINHHKIEDLLGQTKEGREKYQDPHKVIIEVENWLNEDNLPSEKRIMIGYNVGFDKSFLEELWNKCNSKDSYPWGRRVIDPMIIEIFMDWCKGEMSDNYSLNGTIKKMGIKNEKSHSSLGDTRAMKEVFEKQVGLFKNQLNK